MHKRTSEAVIYDKMGVLRLEELYERRLAIFVFKRKTDFQVKESSAALRSGGMIAPILSG